MYLGIMKVKFPIFCLKKVRLCYLYNWAEQFLVKMEKNIELRCGYHCFFLKVLEFFLELVYNRDIKI